MFPNMAPKDKPMFASILRAEKTCLAISLTAEINYSLFYGIKLTLYITYINISKWILKWLLKILTYA